MGSVTMLTKRVVVEGVILHIPRKYSFSCNTLVITFFLQCVSRRQSFILKLSFIQKCLTSFVLFILFYLFIYFFNWDSLYTRLNSH